MRCRSSGVIPRSARPTPLNLGRAAAVETLAAITLNTRSLQALHLGMAGPGRARQRETAAARRAAGRASAGLRTDGSPAIEIPQRRRAAVLPNQPHSGDMVALPRPSDPAEIARALLGNR